MIGISGGGGGGGGMGKNPGIRNETILYSFQKKWVEMTIDSP